MINPRPVALGPWAGLWVKFLRPAHGPLRPIHGPIQAHPWAYGLILGPLAGLIVTKVTPSQARPWATYNIPWTGRGPRATGDSR